MAAVVLLILTASLSAMEGIVEVRESSTDLDFKIRFTGVDSETLVEYLLDGHIASLSCTFRIFREKHGIVAFMGDSLVQEIKPKQLAYWDHLSNRYIVERGTERRYYQTEREFLENFLFMPLSISKEKIPCSNDNYVRILGHLQYIEFQPPLNIFSFILPGYSQESTRIRYNILKDCQ